MKCFATVSFLLLATALTSAQDPPAKPSWPEIPKERRAELLEALSQIQREEHPLRRERHERTIVDIGAAAAPRLLAHLVGLEDRAEIELWTSLLTRVTSAENGPILTLELERAWPRRRHIEVTRFCTRRLLDLGHEPARPVVEAMLEKGIEDADLRELAQVTSFRLGTWERLRDIEVLVRKRWGAWRDPLFEVLRARRGERLTARAVELLLEADEDQRLVGLRLLAGGGLEHAVAQVRPFLHTVDRTIQEAAVNAMAFLVEGEKPRHDIPVFELIELANRWKGQ